MLKKTIKLNSTTIEYNLKVNRKSKGIRLTIHTDGCLYVTVSRYIPQFIINRFLVNKSDWILNKIEYFIKNNKNFKTKKQEKEEYDKYKNEALILVKERLEYYNKFFNYKYNKVSIKNQKTRWGSCSRKGNLNFNYKLALLPSDQADYIIVHELCHLKEFNHSQEFWSLVALQIPLYKEIRLKLKKEGLDLG